MSSIQSIHNFPCQILQKSSQNPNFIVTNAFHCSNRIQFPAISIKKSINVKRAFAVRAADEDDWVRDEASAVAVLEADPPAEPTDIENLKKKLVDSFYGTNRGLCAPGETKAVIVELISQLEASNPTPAPTDSLALLTGKWILAYTSFPGFFPLLSMDESLQLVKIDEISQTIDSENFTVQNSVIFTGPLASTEISTNAKFEVRSPKRVQIMFEEGVIGTPQLTDSIVLPEYVEFFGTRIDLAPLKSLLTPVQDTASYVARNISSRPPFKFRISDSSRVSWLLTTYLDDDVRISRDDVGSIYVLIKAGSPLFNP